MTKKFANLYKNRQDHLARIKKESHLEKAKKKKKYGEEFNFKPKVSNKNKNLATKAISKDPIGA